MNTLKIKIFKQQEGVDADVNSFATSPEVVLMGRGIDPQQNGDILVFYRDRRADEKLGEDGKPVEEAPRLSTPEEEKNNMLKTLIEHRSEYIGNRMANEFNFRKYTATIEKVEAKIADCEARLEGKKGDEKHKIDNEKKDLEKELKELVASRTNIEKSIKDNDLHLVLIPQLIKDVEEGNFILAR